MRCFLIILFLTSCSPKAPITCSAVVLDKKNVLQETEVSTVCNCSCPNSGSILDIGGIIGGLTNLWSSNN